MSGKVPRERLFDHCLHRAGMESPKVCSNVSVMTSYCIILTSFIAFMLSTSSVQETVAQFT